MAAIRLLEESGLGEVREERASSGTAKVNIIIVMYKKSSVIIHHNVMQLYWFEKKAIPSDSGEKEIMCTALSSFGVSLKDYQSSMNTPRKRPAPAVPDLMPSARRSPQFSASQATSARTLFVY